MPFSGGTVAAVLLIGYSESVGQTRNDDRVSSSSLSAAHQKNEFT